MSLQLKKCNSRVTKHLPLVILCAFLLVVETSCSKYIEKHLTEDELNQLEKSGSIYKQISDIDYDQGFTGTLLVRKIDGRIRFDDIGTWVRNNSKYGDDAIMVFDSAGIILYYKEYNMNGTTGFECQYWNKTINGKDYLLENMDICDEEGNLIISGHRYWRMTFETSGLYHQGRKRKFGKWKYFDSEANLVHVKDYGEIK